MTTYVVKAYTGSSKASLRSDLTLKTMSETRANRRREKYARLGLNVQLLIIPATR
jgi:hypothetical protein